MPSLQERYDEGMFAFSQGEYDQAAECFREILSEDSEHFDAQLALGMALYRKGDYSAAIVEGHKAERMRPQEQLVHTNLSLFYMRSGDKTAAEHHGLQARIASWRKGDPSPQTSSGDAGLEMAATKPQNLKLPERFPDMPWKKAKH